MWGEAGRGGAKLPSVMAVGGRKKKRKKEENKAKHNGRSEYIFFFLALSYSALPFMTIHCSSSVKNISNNTTIAASFLLY